MKDKKYCKVRDHCHYTGEYRGAPHSICNLKCSVPIFLKILITLHNGSNYDYHFIIKKLREEFRKHCLGENTEKYITFTVPLEKELKRIDKNGEEITKKYIDINLLIAQGLRQAHYQFLTIIFLTQFIKLNVNTLRC